MTVYTWGYKTSAGLDSDKDQLTPTELPIYGPANMKVSLIATGVLHSLIVVDEILYAFGSGESGQLGTGNLKSYASPRKVALPSEVSGLKIVSIAAGAKHSLVVFEDGSVYGFGVSCQVRIE